MLYKILKIDCIYSSYITIKTNVFLTQLSISIFLKPIRCLFPSIRCTGIGVIIGWVVVLVVLMAENAVVLSLVNTGELGAVLSVTVVVVVLGVEVGVVVLLAEVVVVVEIVVEFVGAVVVVDDDVEIEFGAVGVGATE